ncbi:putative late blight resistance protein homolog R1A-3 isoform X1 [Solanum pennellii]|uniref:Late blight resistance protein homolog R1A-3 isoform X1 n=1 Tax=Solanum pennellii TaxID=28526 RepID=A0ABM1GU25_SOLPN|nr:putative late blight resistance protein homolog R1A-3 isoform X1 [Solanum pennellii]
MERGKENEGQTKGEDNKSLVSSVVLREDIVNLVEFTERLIYWHVQTSLEMDEDMMLTSMSLFCHLYYSFFSESCNDETCCISNEIHDFVQSLMFHSIRQDMLVSRKCRDLLEKIKSYISSHSYAEPNMTEDRFIEILDAIFMFLQHLHKCSELIFPSITTPSELLQNVFGNLRDFCRLKVNGCLHEYETIEFGLPHLQLIVERVRHFCFTLLYCQLDIYDKFDASLVNSNLANLLMEVIPVSLEVMHLCCTNLEGSKSEEVGRFFKQLPEASQDILKESLIHLQEHMLNTLTRSASTCNIHVMIEFLLIILTDALKDVIRHDKLLVLLARVIQLAKEIFVFLRNLEENMNEASGSNLNLLENIELLKVDLKNDFLKARADSSPLPFPMSDGPLFMTLLLTDLKDLAYSNAYSVSLIKEEIKQVKQDLEIIRSLFGYAEQELHKDLWTRVLDLAHEAQHAINSILARDHGLLQLIFILPDTVEKIKLVKKEVQEKISESSGIIVANAPNKPVERNSSCTVGKIIVGFEEETEWIIRKLTSGPADIDVISIVGMPGLGKTTLAYRVYNDKSIVDHFDVCAWCTVDQERNEKKLLQKIFNQVIGLKERFNEDHDVADKLRKRLCGQRYLVVLDDMWDTDTLDELMRPFPEFHKGSRVILTSRKKEIALHGKCHSDPLYLRLLKSEESWELLEKRVFGGEGCPDELKDVGKKIARRCGGLPLVVDLIGGVISKKEKKEALWAEVLNDLSSSIFKDEEEVVKVIQLSYDHLSDHVKPCLVYLATYPKDQDIRISELNDLWISQGLEMKSAEEVVDELISSSLVIPFDDSIFKIHDLVHDFCDIKCRKEKLLHFIGGSKAPSSSDLMPRGIIFDYNKYVYFAVFDPRQKIPSVKHLLSLKDFGMTSDCLSYKSHLKHLRLLKSLDLCGITLPESLLNEIGTLVHLKYLRIQMKAKVLPPSFSNLCNLETLMVNNGNQSCMILSPCFWSLAELRVVKMIWGAVFDPVITVLDEDLRLENLTTLSNLYILGSEDTEDIFKRFPNLKNLQVDIKNQIPENICFTRLAVLNKLELIFSGSPRNSFPEYTHGFPLSLKILKLKGFAVTSDTLSRLPNLEELSLEDAIIEEGKEWNMEDHVIFQDLKYLKLVALNFSEWKVDAEKSFPVLEKLVIGSCDMLMEIPDSFGDIASLKFIRVWSSPQLKESLFKIKEYVEEMTGENKLHVEFYSWGSY